VAISFRSFCSLALLTKIVCTVSGGGAGRASQGCDPAALVCASAWGASIMKASAQRAATAANLGAYLPFTTPFSRMSPLSGCFQEQHGACFDRAQSIFCPTRRAERESAQQMSQRFVNRP